MKSLEPALVWQGRLQLGDDPGVFADASYCGLTTELPITLERLDASGSDKAILVVETENVETFDNYPGHLVTVTLYEPDPGDVNRYVGTVVVTARLTSASEDRVEIPVELTNKASPIFLGLRVSIDTTVPPGLYDDFVLVRVSNVVESSRLVAGLGFYR